MTIERLRGRAGVPEGQGLLVFPPRKRGSKRVVAGFYLAFEGFSMIHVLSWMSQGLSPFSRPSYGFKALPSATPAKRRSGCLELFARCLARRELAFDSAFRRFTGGVKALHACHRALKT